MRPQPPATAQKPWVFDSDLDAPSYIRRLLHVYTRTRTTLGRVRPEDRRLAFQLYRNRVPLTLLQAAFSLAAARRIFRDPDAPPLAPIRSLRYFLPVLEEIRNQNIDPGYLRFVHWKVKHADEILENYRRTLRCYGPHHEDL